MNGSKISRAISQSFQIDCLTLLELKCKVIYQLELNAPLPLKMGFSNGILLQNTTPNENIVWKVIFICILLEKE